MFTCVAWQLPGLYCHMLGSKDLYHERLHAMRVVMGFMLDVLIGELLTEYIFKLEGATKHIKHIEWQNIWFTYGSQWANLISCDFEKNTFQNLYKFLNFYKFCSASTRRDKTSSASLCWLSWKCCSGSSYLILDNVAA